MTTITMLEDIDADDALWWARDLECWRQRGASRFVPHKTRDQVTVGQGRGPTEEAAYRAIVDEVRYVQRGLQRERERELALVYKTFRYYVVRHPELTHMGRLQVTAEQLRLSVHEVQDALVDAEQCGVGEVA